MQHLPIFVTITGKSVLVVGRGDIAAAKARLIALAGGIPVHCMCDNPAASANCTRDYALAFIAVDDVAEAATWAHALKAKGLMVNVADLPALCDFILPAIVDRHPVLVAISTGGASATVAKRLREALETWLPAKLGDVVAALAAARAGVAERLTTVGERRRFWDAMLKPGGPFDPLCLQQQPDPAALVAAAAQPPEHPRWISVIKPRSVDPDDMSLKMLRRLQAADVIVTIGDLVAPLAERGRRDAKLLTCSATAAPRLLAQLMEDTHTHQIVMIVDNTGVALLPSNGWQFESLN